MSEMHILRPGEFTDMAGRKVTLSASDLRGVAARYRAGTAPLIRGHSPASSDAADGWIAELRADERGLHARPKDVSDELRAANRLGRYRFCSAKLRRGEKGWDLVHVGMLGAAEPAVRGLDQVELAAGEEPGDVLIADAVALQTPNEDDDDARIGRWFRGLFRRAPELPTAVLSAPQEEKMSGLKERERALAAQESSLAAARRAIEERERALAQAEAERSRTAAFAFAKGLVDQGRILPRQEESIALLVAALDGGAVEGEPMTVELSAGQAGAAPRKVEAGQVLRQFLGELPEQVPYGEIAGAEDEEKHAEASFTAPGGLPVDKERLALHLRAKALAAEKGIAYAPAVSLAAQERGSA